MKYLLFFVALWFVFANFDVSWDAFDNQLFKAYSATKTSSESSGSEISEFHSAGVTEFRFQDKKVVTGLLGVVKEYENCKIFDPNSWSCTHSDDSGTFGARQGKYFETTNIVKFPHLSYLSTTVGFSRYEYVLLQCRQKTTQGIFGFIMCLFVPFTV